MACDSAALASLLPAEASDPFTRMCNTGAAQAPAALTHKCHGQSKDDYELMTKSTVRTTARALGCHSLVDP